MHYFVTGATGFIGKRLVARLLERKGSVVYFLVREKSAKRVDELLEHWGVDKTRAVPVHGDLALPGLGITEGRPQQARAQDDHPLLPSRGGVRPQGGRGVAARRQHRRHAQRGRASRTTSAPPASTT